MKQIQIAFVGQQQLRAKTPNDMQNKFSDVQSKFKRGQNNVSLYNLIKNHQVKQNDLRYRKIKEIDLSSFGLNNILVDNQENSQQFKKYLQELKQALKLEKQARRKKEEEFGKDLMGNQRDLFNVSNDIYKFYKEFDVKTERVLFFNKSILNEMIHQNISEKNHMINIHQIESNLDRLKKNFVSIVENGLLEINEKVTIAIADILRCYNLIIDKLCSDIMITQEQQKENNHVKYYSCKLHFPPQIYIFITNLKFILYFYVNCEYLQLIIILYQINLNQKYFIIKTNSVKQLEEEILRLRIKLNEQKRSTEILQEDISIKQRYFNGKLKDQSILNQSLIQELNDSQSLLQNSLDENKKNILITNSEEGQLINNENLKKQKKQSHTFINIDTSEEIHQAQSLQIKKSQKQQQNEETDNDKTRRSSSSTLSQLQIQEKSILTTQFLMHIKPSKRPSFSRQDSLNNNNGKSNLKMLSNIQFWKGVKLFDKFCC